MAAPVIATKSSTVQNSFETSVTLTAPSGISDGDLLLIVVNTDSDATAFSLPSGFIRITPADGDKGPSDQVTQYIIYKIASSESGDYTVTWTASVKSTSYMYRITGVSTVGPEVQDPNNPNSGATDPMIALDFLTDSADVLAFAFHTNNNIQSTNSVGGTGWVNEDYNEVGSGGGSMTGAVSIKTLTAIGQTLDCTYPISSLPAWTARQIAIRSLAPTVSITHDTDSVIRELDNEITHTTDSRVVLGISLTHDTDSIVKQIDNELIHDTDSIVRAIQTIFHTTDSMVNEIFTVTHTTDSLVVLGLTVLHTTDSVLKVLDNEISHTTDSLVYLSVTVTHDTDSLVKAIDILLTHDTDSVLKVLDNITIHTTDSAVRQIDNELSHTSDSLVRQTFSLIHTTDSFIVILTVQPLIHTTDSIVKVLDNLVTHTTDSFIVPFRGLVSKTIEADLCVEDESTEELCVTPELEVDLCA